MNQLTQEWIDKAESDFRTATREIQLESDYPSDLLRFSRSIII
jgi:hypothetical protein